MLDKKSLHSLSNLIHRYRHVITEKRGNACIKKIGRIFLSIESLACSLSCSNNGNSLPLLSSGSHTLLGVTYLKSIQPAKPTKRKRRTEASLSIIQVLLYKKESHIETNNSVHVLAAGVQELEKKHSTTLGHHTCMSTRVLTSYSHRYIPLIQRNFFSSMCELSSYGLRGGHSKRIGCATSILCVYNTNCQNNTSKPM